MKTTINALRMRITSLENDAQRIYRRMSQNTTGLRIRDLSGAETELRTPEDLMGMLDNYREHTNEIARLKGIVAVLNTSTTLSNGKSIAETIALLNNLRREQSFIRSIMDETDTIRRRSDGNMSTTAAYYEVTYMNFDRKVLEDRCKDLSDTINALEEELNAINSREVEVED